MDSPAFMVTLCRLSEPVTIRSPATGPLASFTFFTSRLRQRDGSERHYLHMGYFTTLTAAKEWALHLQTRYPNAVATPVPPALLQQSSSDAAPRQAAATAAAPAVQEFPPVKDEPLTDTRMMRILETRKAGTAQNGPEAPKANPVELLRPDDTATRRSLKAAVAEGVLVPFAVQLEWSMSPIEADRVPLLGVFKGYTLYRTEKSRGGRCCYFLRLGFFPDAISAKELASQVRSTFASAAVVPVTEQEFLHADEARIDTGTAAGPLHQESEAVNPDRYGTLAYQTSSFMERIKPEAQKPKRKSAETLEETLQRLAQKEETLERLAQNKKEYAAKQDPLSDSGVRHLKVSVEEESAAKSSHKPKPPTRPA